MSDNKLNNRIIDKIIIKFEIELLSGMHIGTTDGIAVIGDVDSIVIRDPLTNKTIIPGSSLKGKMKSLLMRSHNIINAEDDYIIERVFGSKSLKSYAKLQFNDSLLSNESMKELEKKELDLPYTEVKSENTIDPITLKANPRQIERAVRGSRFDVEIIYTVTDENEIEEDFEAVKAGKMD